MEKIESMEKKMNELEALVADLRSQVHKLKHYSTESDAVVEFKEASLKELDIARKRATELEAERDLYKQKYEANDEAARAAAKAIAKAEYRIKHLVRNLNAKDADIANLKKENFKNEYRIKFILRALERAEAK